jgi:hypothetical protein
LTIDIHNSVFFVKLPADRLAPIIVHSEIRMRAIGAILSLAVLLMGCENQYQDDGMPRIRTQSQVDAYNLTVGSEGEKLICTREQVTGTNLRRFACTTLDQRDRNARNAQNTIEQARSAGVFN